MQVSGTSINRKVNFGAAKVRVESISDSHCNLDKIEDIYRMFTEGCSKDDDKTKIYVTSSGDYLINPAKQGFKTDPEKTAGDFQVKFLNELVKRLKQKVPNFQKFYYTPGNHCFDAGDEYFFDHIKDADVTTIISNANLDKSPVLDKLSEKEKSKIKEQEVIEIPDDKNPEKKHKILMLGLTMMSTDFYTPGLVNGLDIIDRNNKKDLYIGKDELNGTFDKLAKDIGDFRKENPQGAVVLMSHTGNKLSKTIAEEMMERSTPEKDLHIDYIPNGHDHGDEEIVVKSPDNKKTVITSLLKDNRKVNTFKFHFDDNGDLDEINSKPLYSKDLPKSENGYFDKEFKEIFKEDIKPILEINGPKGLDKLDYRKAGSKNNYLANFVTDSALESLKKYEPDTQILGIRSHMLRGSLPLNRKASNLELVNVLDGCKTVFSEMYTAKLKGSELADIVAEYVKKNNANKRRFAIMQWSGLQVDKSRLLSALKSENKEEIEQSIKIKNLNNEYEPLNMEKSYKTAFPKEFFKVPNYTEVMNREDKFNPTGKKLDKLFLEYLKDNDYKVDGPDINDIRVKK